MTTRLSRLTAARLAASGSSPWAVSIAVVEANRPETAGTPALT